MSFQIRRREFIAGMGAAALAGKAAWASMDSPFHLGVITDEISQDFGHACDVAANDFGMHFIELRELWGKNLFNKSYYVAGFAQGLGAFVNAGGTAAANGFVGFYGVPRTFGLEASYRY